MIINQNMDALNAARRGLLRGNEAIKQTGELTVSARRLSGGARVNRAGDDEAGEAVSEKLRTQARGLAQASRNASDAISFIQTTEGWLNEVTTVLQRMRVLSIQSANGTCSEEDRSAIQVEVDQLMDEVDRIGEQADFATARMLAAGAAAQGGPAGEKGTTPVRIDTPASLQNATASWTLRVHVGADTNEAIAANIFAVGAAHLFAGEVSVPDLKPGEIAPIAPVEPEKVDVTSTEAAADAVARIDTALAGLAAQRSDLAEFREVVADAGGAAEVEIEQVELVGYWETDERTAELADAQLGLADVLEALLTDPDTAPVVQTWAEDGPGAELTPEAVAKALGDAELGEMATSAGVTPEQAARTLAAEVPKLVARPAAPDAAIARIDVAIKATTDQLSNLGAFQNRLESVTRGADHAVENLTASDSRVRDVNTAFEMVSFTKNNILLAAAQSMLAQANQIPQGVLRLLG
ncbi:hypothetical protein BJP25_19425 [Actinokineospora bangkokensis]|uniref:Flagellin n=1 Tax=Actinokineospora bangkokensis TaxID=1193682 RepID=A0A1Q9LL96_9PSEU|nr:hypothetical protein BJP25_19425 [Actinokineospora bangkokensis]